MQRTLNVLKSYFQVWISVDNIKNPPQNRKDLRRIFLTVLFHSFDHLQTCKLFSFFFLQGIGDISGESFISWDGDILQGVGTLLGFFDIGGKPDSSFTRSKAALASSRDSLVL